MQSRGRSAAALVLSNSRRRFGFDRRLGGDQYGATQIKGDKVGITDKITGKAKQAAGDITGDSETRREGLREEEKGEKKDQLDNAQEKADRKADEVADLERKT
jgi:uncharacterized protein YjbJ (UPF0337 family)